MNTPPPIEERDWLAQERSLSEAADRRDALLSRALRTTPVSQPPAGFAADVARLAAMRAAAPGDTGLERRLQAWLFGAMAVGALVAMLVYGGTIWRWSVDALGAGAMQWTLLGGACLALSWMPAGLRQLSGRGVGTQGTSAA